MNKLFNPFFFREALYSFWRSRFMSLISIGSITIALLAQGAYLLTVRNTESLLASMEDRIEMVAYFKDGLPGEKIQQAANAVSAMPGCKGVTIINPDQAAESLSSDPELKRFLQTLGKNPLPASLRIHLDNKNPEFLNDLASKIKAMEEVDEVNYGQETVERVLNIFKVFRLVLWIVGLLLSMAALLIVSNIIRLTVFARREEISIMKLVGASNFFIRAPFVLEGCLQGLAAGLLAAGLLYSLGRFIDYQVSKELSLNLSVYMPYGVSLLFSSKLAALGALLGGVGSLVSVGRYLRA